MNRYLEKIANMVVTHGLVGAGLGAGLGAWQVHKINKKKPGSMGRGSAATMIGTYAGMGGAMGAALGKERTNLSEFKAKWKAGAGEREDKYRKWQEDSTKREDNYKKWKEENDRFWEEQGKKWYSGGHSNNSGGYRNSGGRSSYSSPDIDSHYSNLGLKKEHLKTKAEVKTAYKKKMQEVHPDRLASKLGRQPTEKELAEANRKAAQVSDSMDRIKKHPHFEKLAYLVELINRK